MRNTLGTTRVGGSAVAKQSGSRRGAAVLSVATMLVLFLLAAGCGDSSSADPFLGTWSAAGLGNRSRHRQAGG